MCVRSKTQYGCGHCVKITEPCDIQDCTTMAKWKFPVHKDCQQCRSGGDTIKRGREGRGRYAREICKRKARQSFSADSLSPPSLSSPVSPWACNDPPQSREKRWDTPTRQRADEAWITEHERRQSDLEEAVSKISLSSPRKSRNQYEKVIEADEVEEPDDLELLSPLRLRPLKLLAYETSHGSDNSRSYHSSRKASHDSNRSTQHKELVLETPRRQLYLETTWASHGREPAPQQLVRKTRRVKTEPIYPQSCSLQAPVTVLPTSNSIMGAHWTNQYETIVQPLQHDIYYPRTYPVY